MNKSQYYPRIVDRLLARKLQGKGAILIEGAKWCGKTRTAEEICRSVIYMTEPGRARQNIEMALINPKLLLKGEKPRLIDEWQVAPQLWDAVRFEVDHTEELGQFVLTGSSVPPDMSSVFHTGTGRIGWIRMRPMSLWESKESTGEVSLTNLFNGETEVSGISDMTLEDVAFVTCRGGWPLAVKMNGNVALDQAFDYVSAVEKQDVYAFDGVMRDHNRVHRLLRSYARHQGTQASISVIRDDMQVNEGDGVSVDTVSAYIRTLKHIFVIEDMEAWNPNLRSKTAIRSSDTHYFTDPSIATAALGLGPQDLVNDLETFGLLFETLCVRDLRVYSEILNGNVFHYRDKNGLECDAVIHLRDGRYGLIEIKLGGEKNIEQGAQTLKTFTEKIDYSKMREPSFRMILTAAGNYAYKRADGILVVPVGCLKD